LIENGSLLILGLGNVLCGDDGLGVAAAGRLARCYEGRPNVRILDGGTLGLSLLALLEESENILLLDAVQMDEKPGSLVRLEGEQVGPAVYERLSPHQVGVADLLSAMRLREQLPKRLLLLGLVPATLELGLGRSPEVEAALPLLVERTVEECDRLGFSLRARESDALEPGNPWNTLAAFGL